MERCHWCHTPEFRFLFLLLGARSLLISLCSHFLPPLHCAFQVPLPAAGSQLHRPKEELATFSLSPLPEPPPLFQAHENHSLHLMAITCPHLFATWLAAVSSTPIPVTILKDGSTAPRSTFQCLSDADSISHSGSVCLTWGVRTHPLAWSSGAKVLGGNCSSDRLQKNFE